MSVNAISNYSYIYSTTYDSSIQYRFFRAVISNEQLKELFSKYGIVPSGDSYTDLHALYVAMHADVEAEVIGNIAYNEMQNQKAQAANQDTSQNLNQIPWANVMSQVSLAATGDFSIDYSAFNTKISAMQASAQTPTEKANIAQLQAQASIVFIPQETKVSQAVPQSSLQSEVQSLTVSSLVGADITAQLNKLYFMSR